MENSKTPGNFENSSIDSVSNKSMSGQSTLDAERETLAEARRIIWAAEISAEFFDEQIMVPTKRIGADCTTYLVCNQVHDTWQVQVSNNRIKSTKPIEPKHVASLVSATYSKYADYDFNVPNGIYESSAGTFHFVNEQKIYGIVENRPVLINSKIARQQFFVAFLLGEVKWTRANNS